MVNQSLELNLIFGSLSDPTRRDILTRVARKVLSINEIAEPYDMSLAAVSKHVKILEKAKLVSKKRKGKEQLIEISPLAVKDAAEYLRQYEQMWNLRLDSLEDFLLSLP